MQAQAKSLREQAALSDDVEDKRSLLRYVMSCHRTHFPGLPSLSLAFVFLDCFAAAAEKPLAWTTQLSMLC
jgi:hypothetical protein